METDNVGTVQATYSYGRGLISVNGAGADFYYHYDGLGSVKQLTDVSGTIVVSHSYDAFGNLIASSGTSDNTYGFTGEQQFSEADNLVFLRARYYTPVLGRFISRDPIINIIHRSGLSIYFLLMKPKNLNPYVYSINNPVNLTDPTGYMTEGQCMIECEEVGEGMRNGGCDQYCGCGNRGNACIIVSGYNQGLCMACCRTGSWEHPGDPPIPVDDPEGCVMIFRLIRNSTYAGCQSGGLGDWLPFVPILIFFMLLTLKSGYLIKSCYCMRDEYKEIANERKLETNK